MRGGGRPTCWPFPLSQMPGVMEGGEGHAGDPLLLAGGVQTQGQWAESPGPRRAAQARRPPVGPGGQGSFPWAAEGQPERLP